MPARKMWHDEPRNKRLSRIRRARATRLIASTATPTLGLFDISGNVTDYDDAAIENATVSLYTSGDVLVDSATTDSSGDYTISNAPRGDNVYLVCEHADYSFPDFGVSAAFNIEEADITGKDFQQYIPSDVDQAEADALLWLHRNLGGANWTQAVNWSTEANVADWDYVTVATGHVTAFDVSADGDNVAGDLTDFPIDDLSSLTSFKFESSLLSGDASGWTVPTSVTTVMLRCGLITKLPDLSGLTGAQSLDISNCDTLLAADYDTFLSQLYADRAAFTYATPVADIRNGSTVDPTGSYADEDPPTTGLGYLYELENDPETEGFNTWTISWSGS